ERFVTRLGSSWDSAFLLLTACGNGLVLLRRDSRQSLDSDSSFRHHGLGSLQNDRANDDRHIERSHPIGIKTNAHYGSVSVGSDLDRIRMQAAQVVGRYHLHSHWT